MKNCALVVIDLQNDITKNYKDIIDNVNQAIDFAIGKGMQVVYIKQNNLSPGTRTFKSGTRGAELVSELKTVSDNIFVKTKSNALTSEEFAAFIIRTASRSFISQAQTQRRASNLLVSIWQKRATPSTFFPIA